MTEEFVCPASEESFCQGAEARLYLTTVNGNEVICKERFSKKYRVVELDKHIRHTNVRNEVRALKKCAQKNIPAPRLLSFDIDSCCVYMSKLTGIAVKNHLDKEFSSDEIIGMKIGALVAAIHLAGFVHGDLTTSNFIIDTKTTNISVIDFGLSTTTSTEENRAVDLHVLEKAMGSAHPKRDGLTTGFLEGYREKIREGKNGVELERKIFQRLEVVRARGRKRSMVG